MNILWIVTKEGTIVKKFKKLRTSIVLDDIEEEINISRQKMSHNFKKLRTSVVLDDVEEEINISRQKMTVTVFRMFREV